MTFKRVVELSEKQAEVFAYIVEFVCENGYQPSVGEIAEHFGVTRRAIADRLRQLASKGYVALPGRHQDRCYRLTNVKYEAKFVEQ